MNTATSHDGTTIAYDVMGDGPPLVSITGATCFRRFKPVAADAKTFSSKFRVINYDRRGRGDSTDTAPWSLEREIEDIDAMIDALGGRACLYGHSSGAVLALHAAHALGEKVQSTVLYDASWVADQAERESYATLRAEVDSLLDAGRNAAALRRFLIEIGMPRAFVTMLPLMPGWRTMVELAPTLRYDMALTADLPPLDVAAGVATPLHVLVGERSPASLHAVARMVAQAAGVEVTTLAKQDHMASAKVLLTELVARCV